MADSTWQGIEAKQLTSAYGRIASLTSCTAQATASPLGAAQVMLCPLAEGAPQSLPVCPTIKILLISVGIDGIQNMQNSLRRSQHNFSQRIVVHRRMGIVPLAEYVPLR